MGALPHGPRLPIALVLVDLYVDHMSEAKTFGLTAAAIKREFAEALYCTLAPSRN